MVKQLMESDKYIPLQQMADEYGISLRTVRADLLQLEDWLRERGVSLVRDRSAGVSLRLATGQSEQLALQMGERPDYMDAEQRVSLLMKQLLQETSLSVKTVMEEFGISKNTLLQDLNEIRERLTGWDLTLIRDRGQLHIEGSEKRKRRAYLHLLRSEITDDKLLRYILDQRGANYSPMTPWKDWFEADDAAMLFDTIQRLEEKMGVQFTDAGYSTLILHLLMAMERLRGTHSIEMDRESLSELQDHEAYELVKTEVVPRIERHFQVKLPATEIGYITQHILGAQKQSLPAEDLIIADLAKQIIVRTEQELGRPLQMIDQIVQGLVIHLKPAIYRAKFGLQSKNPLMEQLEAQYGSLLNVLERIVNEVMAPWSVTFDRNEVGYIMFHIGSGLIPPKAPTRKRVAIVCGSGLGTSAMLKRRVAAIFPQVDIVGTYSYKESSEITLQTADAILSTMEISHALQVPWMKVSPLLNQDDQKQITSFLGVSPSGESAAAAAAVQAVNDIFHVVERNAHIHNRNRLLEELLHLFQGGSRLEEPREEDYGLTALLAPESISLGAEGMSWEDAVREGNRLLIQQGVTDARYGEKLVEIISTNNHPFIIRAGVAFPHVYMPECVKRTGFSIMTFQEELAFGPSGQPVWFVITLAAVDKERHVAALGTLLDALNDDAFMAELKSSRDGREIWQRLREKEGFE
ncbi:transcription antiterminator [Paenibacillus sp. Marseille-P2973]|uniref:BglG family transcription antiterminator n=1 Tax=Paenibacillus sp. Marseille-P2973 TaxID=1871032 RepID=UPI001B35E264|nr:BglG family transcription antiterminator [Paenibacillus sp. Marseille-P2973]MBQ4898737.1 transcription antiterminator [Paenibacillus sp. Marseille-P2973]